MLSQNSHVQTLDFNSSSIGLGLSRIATAIRQKVMPLVTLLLAENQIAVALAVELVHALRDGAPTLTDLDLSGNPVLGVEEGGKDEYTTEFIDELCAWMQEGSKLSVLQLVDVALCGLARDGNGSYQSQAITVLNETLASGSVALRSLNVSGCKVREDDAHHLGKGLVRNRSLERLVLDKTALMVQQVRRAGQTARPTNAKGVWRDTVQSCWSPRTAGDASALAPEGGLLTREIASRLLRSLPLWQLARGERLSLNAVDFSEVDATLMGQLLLQNFSLSCMDLGGSKPLQKEIKVLSDAFVRCRFPLRELSVSGRMLGLEGSASLLDALKECPLEVLDLYAAHRIEPDSRATRLVL